MAIDKRIPRCIIIAGPNGAGKTTFARQYLPRVARVVHFVNADLIAGGLSPLKPEMAAIAKRSGLRAAAAVVETRWIPHRDYLS
jgi:predicted ABC-type ATPase